MSKTPNSRSDSQVKDRLIAGGATLLAALLLLLVLFFSTIGEDRPELARDSIPELAVDDELFLEPELLDPGQQDASTDDQPADALQGEPEQAPQPQPETVVKGKNEKPAPQREKLATQKKESPVKATEPQQTDKEPKKAADPAAGKFSGQSGNPTGKADGKASSGTGGDGAVGSLHGRSFLGSDTPKVSLRHKTVIVVDVRVNAEGRVVSASARSGGDAAMRRECERAARTARWSAKKGASEAAGTITFTITPK